jgi:hypothetical protein
MDRRHVKEYLYKTDGFRIVALVIFVFSIFLFSSGMAFSESDGTSSTSKPRRLIFRADPNLSSSTVEAPSGFLAERAKGLKSSKTRFTIEYAAKGAKHSDYECGEWPEQAKEALNYAMEIWAYYLRSTPKISIETCWVVSGMEADTLGTADEPDFRHDFKGAKKEKTWYTIALANSLHGSDLKLNSPDMYLSYNSKYAWYFGTDGQVPDGKYDFVSVVLHEIAHGLGIFGTASVDKKTSIGSWGKKDGTNNYPDAWDRFIENGSKQSLIDTGVSANPSQDLARQLTGQDLYFNGSNAVQANGNKTVKIYAPAEWSDGSSYGHLDEDTFKNTQDSLMIPAIEPKQYKHSAGPVTLGILTDMGWTATAYTLEVVLAGNKKGSVKATGLTCGSGSTCKGGYQLGETVDITATAASGSVFYGWTGCASVSDTVCHVTMSAATTVTATFNSRPAASVSPTSINFGATDIAGPFTSRKITVTNKGGATLAITSVTVSGAFEGSNGCESLAQNKTCTIEVVPKPESSSSYGTKAGSVVITSNDPGSPDTVKLSVNFSPPNILAPSAVNFGTEYIGDSETKTITIKNTGVSTLTLTKIGLRDSNPTLDVRSSGCTSLTKNAHCNISVTFTPEDTTQVTDYLDITSNDPDFSGKVKTITVTGKGAEAKEKKRR